MALGAIVGVYALDSLSGDAIVYLSGLLPLGGPVIAIILVLGMIGANCDNLYGPYMAGLSTVTQAGGPPHVSRVVRAAATGAFALLGTGIGIFLSGDFLANLENLIMLLLYMLVPWTAINLVDFYLITTAATTSSNSDDARPLRPGQLEGHRHLRRRGRSRSRS